MRAYVHTAACRCRDCREAPARRRAQRLLAIGAVLLVALSPIGHVLVAGVRDILVLGAAR